jgi:apolipoprotein N-acyltransferase
MGARSFLDAALPPPLPPTAYARHGDALPAALGVALLLAALAAGRWRARRE